MWIDRGEGNLTMSNETLIKLTKAIAKREIDSGHEPSSVILEWSSVVVATLEGNCCGKCNGSGEKGGETPAEEKSNGSE